MPRKRVRITPEARALYGRLRRARKPGSWWQAYGELHEMITLPPWTWPAAEVEGLGEIACPAGITRADRNIAWIHHFCRVPEGKDVGRPLRLRDWQQKEIRNIYDNPARTRQAIVSFGKKNGKTSMSGTLLLLHLCGPESSPNSQLVSTAQSRDQAAVIHDLAAKMVRLDDALNACITIRDTAKQLLCRRRGTTYKALSADVTTAHGQSPVFCVHDELGVVAGPRSSLFTAVEHSMGAHDNPMSIVISTQAPTDGDLLSQLIDDALAGNDPRTVVSLYTADRDADPFAEETIKAANPAFGDFLSRDEVLTQAERARRLATEEAEFRNYVLNQRVEAVSGFITDSDWLRCGGEAMLSGAVYGGLDLSEANDLTAFVLASARDGMLHLKPIFWLPEEGLAERSRRDRVEYDIWRDAGYLETTPGRSIAYRDVAARIAEVLEAHNVTRIAFDRWNFRHLRPWLVEAGIPESKIDAVFTEFGQGYQSMSPALRTLESLFLDGRVRHGDHPVLRMCFRNAVVTRDPAGNRKFDKKRARGRIDGAVAAAMAAAMAERELNARPVFSVPIESIIEDLGLRG